MESFKYQAYNKEGLKVEGVAEGPDLEFVKTSLKGQGLVPIRIDKSGSSGKSFLGQLKSGKRVGFSELEFFSSEISVLLRNGVKVDRALGIIQNGVREEALGKLVEKIYADVRKGASLAEALKKREDVFDSLYVSVVSIGEKTGKLADAFQDLEKTLKFRKQISSRIRQAIAYPTFILVFCLLALMFIFTFIIPKFSALFDPGMDIPVYTQILMSMSAFFRDYQLFIFGGLAALGVFSVRIVRMESFKKVRDYVLYRLPGVSGVALTLENLRFSSALKILLKNNVVIDEALSYAVAAVGNRYFKARIRFLPEDIKKGKNLSEILSKTYFFPPSFISLIEVGEHSGSTPEIFEDLENRFRIRFEESVMQLATFIEPVLILFMGVMVGSIVIAMLLSIVSFQDIKM